MYPIWEVPFLSSGLVLAIIATFHILPSHLSTSAMWFNVYMESKAYRDNRPELLEFVRKYSLFILVFAYVFGSLSGIGIWFAATVASPRGISGLIHNYVWGWATEWVFFLIEVTGIFIYYYTFGKVDRRTHLRIGWIFAIASWTTMVVITGILAFMVSPGKWPATGGFFDGFFNQTYWAQLFMRTTLMFAVAAAYAILVSSRLKDESVRGTVAGAASKWGVAGLVLGGVLFVFYLKTLPADARGLVGTAMVPAGLKYGMALFAGLLLLYFIYVAVSPLRVRFLPALIAVVVLFGGIWSTERIREMVRKPYIIPQYMYSNQVIGRDIPAEGVKAEVSMIDRKGVLKSAAFVPDGLREVTEGNRLEAGRMVALIECSSCHVMGERGLRPMPQMVRRLEFKPHEEAETEIKEIEGFIGILGGYPYMPPFMGTAEEKTALAAYLHSISRMR